MELTEGPFAVDVAQIDAPSIGSPSRPRARGSTVPAGLAILPKPRR
jgi:hypothetical protein